MVILDDDDDGRGKSVVHHTPGPSQPTPEPPPPYSHHASDPLLPKPASSRSSARRRMISALAVVCLAWITLFGILFASYIHFWRIRERSPVSPGTPVHPPAPIPPEHERDASTCSAVPTWPEQVGPYPGDPLYYADISVTFPEGAETEAFLMQAVGTLGIGTLDIAAADDYHSSHVRVNVRAAHPSRAVLDRANLCRNKAKDGGFGITLFSPSKDDAGLDTEPVLYDIGIKLPNDAYRGGPARYYPKLIVNMPRFNYSVKDGHNVRFGSVLIHANEGSLSVDRLVGDVLSVSTMGGPITGMFSATTSLCLHATDGDINIAVELTDGLLSKPTPTLALQTTDGSINASVALFSDSSNGHGGAFSLHAHAIDGGTTLTVPGAPIDASLLLTASSQGARERTHVVLPPTFEGAFAVHGGYPDRTRVFVREELADPAGEGRERSTNVLIRDAGRTAVGDVRWVDASGDGLHLPKGVTRADVTAEGEAILLV